MRSLVATLILAVGLWGGVHPTPAQAAPPDRPSLVLVVVVDQFASHQMDRWGPLFRGGLRRLLDRGAVYPHGRYAYANTETAAGHATLMTGAWPEVHGVVSNRWFQESTGREEYCFEDPAHGRSPRNMAAPVWADALRLATAGRAKTVALSFKDRAAIPLGGHRPTLAAWFDETSGRMVAGRWPGARTPAWFEAAVARHPVDAARGAVWDRVRPDLDYAAHAGPDDHPAEEMIPGLGRTFPRTIPKDLPVAELHDVYSGTPPALEALFALASEAVAKEALGARDTVDLLALGISTTDDVGHWWGTYSQEALDTLLRVDLLLGALLTELDRRLGSDRVLVVLTSDHGATYAPEKARLLGVDARRVDKSAIERAAQVGLRDQARLLDVNSPFIYLSPTPANVDRVALRRRVAAEVAKVEGVAEAHALDDLARFTPPYAEYFRRSLHPGRRPDVLVRVEPHAHVSRVDAEGHGQGTGHGSPYVYDMDVPLIFAGAGVRAGVDRRPYFMTRVAPTLAALVGIAPPAAALDSPLPVVSP